MYIQGPRYCAPARPVNLGEKSPIPDIQYFRHSVLQTSTFHVYIHSVSGSTCHSYCGNLNDIDHRHHHIDLRISKTMNHGRPDETRRSISTWRCQFHQPSCPPAVAVAAVTRWCPSLFIVASWTWRIHWLSSCAS